MASIAFAICEEVDSLQRSFMAALSAAFFGSWVVAARFADLLTSHGYSSFSSVAAGFAIFNGIGLIFGLAFNLMLLLILGFQARTI